MLSCGMLRLEWTKAIPGLFSSVCQTCAWVSRLDVCAQQVSLKAAISRGTGRFLAERRIRKFFRVRATRSTGLRHTQRRQKSNNMGDESEPHEGSEQNFIGLWKREFSVYGGLLLVKKVSECLEGWELLPPGMKDSSQPMRMKPLFRVDACCTMTDENSVVCLAQPNEFETNHEATLKLVEDGSLEFECSSPETHHDEERKFNDLEVFLQEEKGGELQEDEDYPFDGRTVNIKFFKLRKNNLKYRYQRLDTSVWDQDLSFGVKPIAAGLYVANYSILGNEIIELTYQLDSENEPMAVGTKITGDNPVPAGQMTFKAELNYPTTFDSEDEQYDVKVIEHLVKVKRDYAERTDIGEDQPFVLTQHSMTQHGPKLPDTCIHRFHGELADQGELNPRLQKMHWVIFNEDLFAILFVGDIGLADIILYHRVKDLDF